MPDVHVAQNLLDSGTMSLVTNFGADAKVTLIAIVAVIVPATIGIKMIGVSIKVGIAKLFRALKSAL